MSGFLQHGPDGSPFLIMNRMGAPKAPPGYVAVYVDGQWQVIPNSGRYTIGDDQVSRRQFASPTSGKKNSFQTATGAKPGSGGGGSTLP